MTGYCMAIADTAFGRCADGMCMLVHAPCMMEAGGRLHTISSGGMHVGRLAELYVLSLDSMQRMQVVAVWSL